MDTLTQDQRSRQMATVRSKDTKPEMVVRKLVHSLGFRYRLHRKDLPGKPDLVFPGRRSIIFVHGCFWHRHPDPECKLTREPKSRQSYWLSKFQRNVERDAQAQSALEDAGWRVLVIWECQIKDGAALADRIKNFLIGN